MGSFWPSSGQCPVLQTGENSRFVRTSGSNVVIVDTENGRVTFIGACVDRHNNVSPDELVPGKLLKFDTVLAV